MDGQQPPEGEQPQGEQPPEGTAPELPAGEQDSPEAEQIDDVDAILAALDEPEEDEDAGSEDELDEAKMGRPIEGMKFGQDSHPRGRDPLGNKENRDVMRGRIQRRVPSRKSVFALENREISKLIQQLNSNKLDKTKTSILNEENILDIDEKSTD
jgi:hypothetical protein